MYYFVILLCGQDLLPWVCFYRHRHCLLLSYTCVHTLTTNAHTGTHTYLPCSLKDCHPRTFMECFFSAFSHSAFCCCLLMRIKYQVLISVAVSPDIHLLKSRVFSAAIEVSFDFCTDTLNHSPASCHVLCKMLRTFEKFVL